MKHLGFSHARSIHTFTTPYELVVLHKLASKCALDANVVEIGSYLGASTCYIAAGLTGKNSNLYCVDTWQNETMPDGIRDTSTEFSKNLSPSTAKIIKIQKKSSDVVPEDLPGAIDFAFIDGDHSYEAVKSDLLLLEPLMKDESVIAFHDAIYFHGVSRVIGELLEKGRWKLEGQVNNLVWVRQNTFVR